VNHRFYRRHGKRCLDVIIAVFALVLLSPVLAVTAWLVRARLGHPALFVQSRPGRGGRLFRLLKFRTMTDARDHLGNLLPDEVRLTSFGQFLRSSSLDELPELWNVLRGEMSLVGPRPWLPQYLDLYTDQQARRHELCPGITGWAQVNGRNRAGWQDRLQMDVWYVDHCSLWLDVRILVMTVATVLRRSGVSADGHATMPAFTGTAPEIAFGPTPAKPAPEQTRAA
jgi:lipopolysaccharide/colanic/teichoic acid biosynthesis glycosyltransferase